MNSETFDIVELDKESASIHNDLNMLPSTVDTQIYQIIDTEATELNTIKSGLHVVTEDETNQRKAIGKVADLHFVIDYIKAHPDEVKQFASKGIKTFDNLLKAVIKRKENHEVPTQQEINALPEKQSMQEPQEQQEPQESNESNELKASDKPNPNNFTEVSEGVKIYTGEADKKEAEDKEGEKDKAVKENKDADEVSKASKEETPKFTADDIKLLDEWDKRALQLMFDPQAVRSARDSLQTMPRSFREYAELIKSQVQNIQKDLEFEVNMMEENKKMQEELEKSRQLRVEKLYNEIAQRVLAEYKTSCASVDDIKLYIGSHKPSDIEKYSDTLEYIFSNITGTLVKNVISLKIEEWNNITKTARFKEWIDTLRHTGYFYEDNTDDEIFEYTLENLPSTYYHVNDDGTKSGTEANSPKPYLFYLSYKNLLDQKYQSEAPSQEELQDGFADKDMANAYASSYMEHMERGCPSKFAEECATKRVADDPQYKDNILTKAAHAYGSAIRMVESTKDDIAAATRAGLGKYANQYDEKLIRKERERAEKRRRQEEIECEERENYDREEREEREYQRQRREEERRKRNYERERDREYERARYERERYEDRYAQYDRDGRRMRSSYGPHETRWERPDFHLGEKIGRIDPKITIIAVHIIAIIVLYLINKKLGAFSAIGIIVALVGWFRIPMASSRIGGGPEADNKSAFMFILLGYAAVAISFLLVF